MTDAQACPRVVLDLETEVTTRLMAVVEEMPAKERRHDVRPLAAH